MSREIVREPRWPALVAMAAAGCSYWALPEPLSVGPSWSLFAVLVALSLPITMAHRRGNHQLARILAFAANAAITLAMIAALAFLIHGITQNREAPIALLRSASALW